MCRYSVYACGQIDTSAQSALIIMELELDGSGWLKSSVWDLRKAWTDVRIVRGVQTTVLTPKQSQLAVVSIENSSCMHCMYISMSIFYSAPSRFLLSGAPAYSADTESEFHAEAHEQLRVKDLPRVPTRRYEVDSNPQPSSCKAPNIPLHHRAPVVLCCIVLCVVLYSTFILRPSHPQ